MPEYPTTKDRSDKNIDLITTLPIPDMMVALASGRCLWYMLPPIGLVSRLDAFKKLENSAPPEI